MKKWNKDRLRTVLHRGMIGCLALAMAFGVSVESFAAREGKVTTDVANIRSSASAGAERVAKLPNGSTFTVTEETTDGNGYVWYNIVFTLEGAQKSGWVRSDLVEVAAEEAPTEGEGGEIAAPVAAVIDGITVQEPTSQPEVTEDFTASQVTVGETAFTAWAVSPELTEGAEFYLVFGMDAAGNSDWYFYDVQQGTMQRAAGQFMGGGSDETDGLIEALRMENEELQKGQTKSLSVRNYIIIALGILCVLLLIIVIVLAVKLNQVEYVDDDYDEDDEDEDEEVDDRKAGIPSWMEVARARKEEERKQRAKRDELEDELDEEEEFADTYLNREDTYASKQVKRVVQPAPKEPKRAAARAVEKQAHATSSRSSASDDDFDDDDDFDVEILDLDDLNL